MQEKIDQEERKEKTLGALPVQKPFWVTSRFLIANAIVLILVFLGIQFKGAHVLTGTVAEFTISGPFVWYIAVGVVWWIILATFSVERLKGKGLHDKYPNGVFLSAWIITLIPAWLLFVGGLYLYVFVSKASS